MQFASPEDSGSDPRFQVPKESPGYSEVTTQATTRNRPVPQKYPGAFDLTAFSAVFRAASKLVINLGGSDHREDQGRRHRASGGEEEDTAVGDKVSKRLAGVVTIGRLFQKPRDPLRKQAIHGNAVTVGSEYRH
jgi:hypothetical protein